jgi:hypothetical protein
MGTREVQIPYRHEGQKEFGRDCSKQSLMQFASPADIP